MGKTYHATLYGVGDNVFHFRLEGRKQPLKLNREQHHLNHALVGRCYTLEQSNRGRWYVRDTDNQPHTTSGGIGIIRFANDTFGFLCPETGKDTYFETDREQSKRLTPGTAVFIDLVEYQGRRAAIINKILASAPHPQYATGRMRPFTPGKNGGTLLLPDICDKPLVFQFSQTDPLYQYRQNMLLLVAYIETPVGVMVVKVSPIIEHGVICFFDENEGWGFIEISQHEKRHFRFNALDSSIDHRDVYVGMPVTFTSKETARGITAVTIWPKEKIAQ